MNEELTEKNFCKCGYNPSINSDKFNILYSEFGMKEKILIEEWEYLKNKTCFYLNMVEHDNHQRLINGLKNDYHPDYFNVRNILEKLGSEWKDDEFVLKILKDENNVKYFIDDEEVCASDINGKFFLKVIVDEKLGSEWHDDENN